MAIKANELVEYRLLDVKAVKEKLHIGINQARRVVREINEELKAKNKRVIPYRVPEQYLLERYDLLGVKR